MWISRNFVSLHPEYIVYVLNKIRTSNYNLNINMKFLKVLTVLLLNILMLNVAYAQDKQPAGVRMEVAEAETDNGDYSIFTYKDTDDSFNYYLSLGRMRNFLGADEILGMSVKNAKEITIWLGSTCDEALDTIESILDLFDKDVDTSVEFKGRSVSGGGAIGDSTTTTCVVKKKPLVGKRLEFLFTSGKNETKAYLTKSVLKELRMNFKTDIKFHPKKHNKK